MFVTRDTTGALSAATSGPAGTLYVNGVSNAATVTITGSNPYKFSVTLPSLSAGDLVNVYITATIATIATAAVVFTDTADTLYGSDTHTVTVGTNNDKTGYTLTVTPPTAAQIDTQLSNTHGSGTWGGSAGAGSTSTTLTVTVSSTPQDGVNVWVTTDSNGSNIVASGMTDAFGQVTFLLDPGDYYAWKQLSGYNFTNPETFTVT